MVLVPQVGIFLQKIRYVSLLSFFWNWSLWKMQIDWSAMELLYPHTIPCSLHTTINCCPLSTGISTYEIKCIYVQQQWSYVMGSSPVKARRTFSQNVYWALQNTIVLLLISESPGYQHWNPILWYSASMCKKCLKVRGKTLFYNL